MNSWLVRWNIYFYLTVFFQHSKWYVGKDKCIGITFFPQRVCPWPSQRRNLPLIVNTRSTSLHVRLWRIFRIKGHPFWIAWKISLSCSLCMFAICTPVVFFGSDLMMSASTSSILRMKKKTIIVIYFCLRPYKLTRGDVRCTWHPRRWSGYEVRGERIGQGMHWCSCRLHEKWGQIRSHRFPADTENNEKRHGIQEIELRRLDDIVDHLHVASTEVRQR